MCIFHKTYIDRKCVYIKEMIRNTTTGVNT